VIQSTVTRHDEIGSVRNMTTEHEQNKKTKDKSSTARNLWRLALLIVGVVAMIQELRKPPNERAWHGKVADFVPYDFRKPTVERFSQTYWNPDGPMLSPKAWGVGWAPNFGAVKRLLGD
jgi:hypothetical protein